MDDSKHPRSRRFETTCWTEVLQASGRHGEIRITGPKTAPQDDSQQEDSQQNPSQSGPENSGFDDAGDADSGVARAALELLCERYWYPLYAYLRRTGQSPDDAQDSVQGFFADLLSRNGLVAADPARGRFRSFLLTACQNFVRNRHRSENTQRRGGNRQTFSLDIQLGEQRYSLEPSDTQTAGTLYRRRWAMQVIDAAIARVENVQVTAGRGERFAAIKPLLMPGPDAQSYETVAQRLGITTGAVKVAVHRLRGALAKAMREEIASTLDCSDPISSPQRIDEELNELMQALGE
ncbi:MAG: sigma-70 family RNA polymerase sigma factor [Planctomycetota bacterium]